MTSTPALLALLADASTKAIRDVELRDRLIVRLYDRGIPLRKLGQVAGLSHETVRKIISETPPLRGSKPLRID